MKMKHLLIFVTISMIFFSCNSQKNNNIAKSEKIVSDTKNQIDLKDEYFEDSFIAPDDFFTLDYTPYLPEDFSPAKYISYNKKNNNKDKSLFSGNEKSSSPIIPGLRSITDYKTEYNTNMAISADFLYNETINGTLATEGELAPTNNEDFTIVSWGPNKEIPASIRRPEFYVMFSEPVVPLAALGGEIKNNPIMTITPEIKGVYRWNGTNILSFIPSENIKPQQSYKITISDSVTSLTGKKLIGEREFNTTAEELKILWAEPGYTYAAKNIEYFDNDDVPPEAAKELRVEFNYMVDAEEIAKKSVFTVGDKEVKNFTVKQESSNTVTYNIKEKLPLETKIKLTVDNTATTSYSTVSKFKFDFKSTPESWGKYSNPVFLYFSHPLDKTTVLQNISTSLNYQLTKDNIEINDDTVIIYGLPVTFNSTYEITIKSGIKDIYGRSLGKKYSEIIKVPNASSLANFTDYGTCILEAKYPHKIVFEHQNLLEGSGYTVQKTETPLDTYCSNYDKKWETFDKESNFNKIVSEPKNQRILQEVDLEPYLTNGRGMVRFEALTKHPLIYTDDEDDTYNQTNITTIQVTDLGVTARIGINKSVILVTNLSDGKPVKNATVYLYNGDEASVSQASTPEYYLGYSTTNEDGLAIIDYDINIAKKWFTDENNFYSSSKPALLVKTENDAVTFVPNSHKPWQSGVWNTEDIANSLEKQMTTFMFSDRGLYKPGETVTFRGIDKDKILGSYVPYTGKYQITISDFKRKDVAVLNDVNLMGETSENGGFYGSFTLPENAEPGNYTISYKRLDGTDNHYRKLDFNVSYFERLKFQAGIKMPESTIIAGDTIQSTISASYLAGGTVSSSRYYASWYSEPWYFSSDLPEFKGYRFGPLNNSDNMNYINETNGELNGLGKAVVSCNTTGNSIKGSPYRYILDADVYDASNQLISTSNSIVVHPASFYIGISKPENVNYIIKKDSEITFNYKLALANGNEVLILNNITKKNPQLTIELLKEEWNVVQQQGINENVYPRYVKEDIVESSTTINLDTNGKFTVKPSKVGYYTLRVSTKDSKDREIITEYSFFSTGSTNNWVMDSSEASLKLTPDQNMYNPGDTATLLLESPLPAGNYLITVEREGIFTEEVRHFDSNVNTIDIPIARNYLPVCYVSVSSYSVRTHEPNNQYGQHDIDKPKGYYGVTKLNVNPYVKAFSIDVKAEKMAYKPGEEATITITATKGGNPLANAEITLMAVDRGVLDLINYHVPNPIDFFYNERNFSLNVKGGDNRSYLMDPVTYSVKNLAGGDADGKMAESKLNVRKDFNPTALFQPVLITDENGQASYTFKLPDTLTTYRITAFGIKDELLALQEDEFQVQNPINVQQVTPRRLRERDTSEVGVIVTNLDSIPHDITVAINTVTPSEVTTVNGVTNKKGKAFVDGKNNHTITVIPGDTIPVYFDVAAEKSGQINLEFTVTSDVLNEKLIYPITIEKPYIFESVTSTGFITGDNKKGQEGIILPSFAEDNLGSLSITLDATRLGPLGSAVKYVFDYPYGCLEQQSSKILPLIIFEDYIDVFNMELDEQITDIRSLVISYFQDWSKYQLENGGFGYWPSSKTSNPYVTAKIAHTYALALERGYTEEELAIKKEPLLNFLMKNIKNYLFNGKNNGLSKYEITYIYYVFTLLDPSKISSSQLERIFVGNNNTVATLALGGLSAIEIGDFKLANKFKDEINKYLRPNAQSIDISDGTFSYFNMYNSKIEQLALTLQLFGKLNHNDPLVTKLIYTLFENQKSGYWQNTSNTSRVLEAFYTIIKQSDLDNLNLNANAAIDGEKLASGSFKGPAAKPVKKEYLFENPTLKKFDTGKLLPIEYTKEGKGDLYYTTSLKYALPSELQIPRDWGLSVVYKLYNDNTGEEISFDKETSSVVELESGTIYRMEITLSSPKDRTYVALRAPIPSGAEILDTTFVTTPKNYDDYYGDDSWQEDNIDDGYNSGYYYMSNQTILDNEVQFFWDIFNKGTTKAEFKFRAVRRGVFPTPPVTAECMYESEIFGRTYGSLFTIK